ncbi:universal stress protein [Halorientalis salina]|jgi:nucleotide-binding universal stress UspA family protein|uniref:universal stress protein n=1 Tax=Halorientalis salina TaxID=2932266 RepID=UPI0010AC5277|nr:universal stress protein [Halorientalis salina]
MTDHVLVPMDESPLSAEALEHALEKHDDADFTVIHVLDFVDAGYGAPMESTLPGYWEEWYESATEEAEALFDDAQDVADEYDVTLDTEAVVGQPGRSVVEYADEHDVDQIVMGSHGRTGLSRLILGSVAENVVRRAHCPVTIVR